MSKMISIVVPLYNKEKHIAATLRSILSQDFVDYEIVIVDDGSTDESVSIVNHFSDARIKLIQQKNKGVSVARNTGISQSTGEFITFLDADDIWYPDFLSEVVGMVEAFPNAGVYATAYEFYSRRHGFYPAKYVNLPPLGWKGYLEEYLCSLDGDPPIHTGSIVVRRSILDSVGGFAISHQLGEDLDMWVRLALHTKIVWSNKICLKYLKVDCSSITASQAISGNFVVTKTLEEYMCDKEISPDSNESREGVKRALSRYYYIESRVYARTGEAYKARAASKKSLKVGGLSGRYRILLWAIFLYLPSFLVKKWIKYRTRRA